MTATLLADHRRRKIARRIRVHLKSSAKKAQLLEAAQKRTDIPLSISRKSGMGFLSIERIKNKISLKHSLLRKSSLWLVYGDPAKPFGTGSRYGMEVSGST